MFGRKKTIPTVQFDKDNFQPILKCSICTGEQVAGFKDIHTGEFHDLMLIRNEDDLNTFRKLYNVDEIKKEY